MESKSEKETIKKIELEENLKSAITKIKDGIAEYEAALMDYDDFGVNSPFGSLRLSAALIKVLEQTHSIKY